MQIFLFSCFGPIIMNFKTSTGIDPGILCSLGIRYTHYATNAYVTIVFENANHSVFLFWFNNYEFQNRSWDRTRNLMLFRSRLYPLPQRSLRFFCTFLWNARIILCTCFGPILMNYKALAKIESGTFCVLSLRFIHYTKEFYAFVILDWTNYSIYLF